jgi:hypothetical protein
MLTDAALDGMKTVAGGVTAGEVFSATLTLALRAMQACERMGYPIEVWRPGLEELYSRLPPQKTN